MLIFAACSGGGNSGGGTSSNPPSGGTGSSQLGFEANWNSGNVSSFGLNSDGTLTALMPPAVAGQHPHTINVDPQGRFVYVANHDSNFLSGYTVNRTTGALTPIAAPTMATGNSPHASVFHKNGRFLYVVNGVAAGETQITAHSVNGDGTLTPIGNPIPTGAHSHNLGIDPSGRFVYVCSEDSNQIFAFTVDQNSGALTPISGSPYPGASGPLDVAVDQATKFAYVSNSGGEIQAFSIDPSTGALTPLSPTAVFPSGGQFAHTIVFDHTGNFLYTGNINSNNVSGFQVNHTTGALTAVQGSPFATGNQPEGVTLHPTAQFLYVSDFGDNNIARFAIDNTTGQLTPNGIFSDPAVTSGTVSGPISLGFTNF
jgi:6-phosphogluconolactonase (cycloisomerase 2 family)